ncbi:MAG: ribonuclease T2 [Pseudomonadota bacterium]
MRAFMILVFLLGSPALAEGERSGDFDYYVLSLSWSPNFCARIDDPDHPQCDPNRNYGFVLHGLWPQYEEGWPSFCPTAERAPSRAMTAAEAPLYGSSGSAWHQWRKHGTCSGLSAPAYYETAREALRSVKLPSILRKIDREMEINPKVLEETFLEVNPEMTPDQVTITCKSNMFQEVRICMTKDLELRTCGSDVVRDCTLPDPLFLPILSNQPE